MGINAMAYSELVDAVPGDHGESVGWDPIAEVERVLPLLLAMGLRPGQTDLDLVVLSLVEAAGPDPLPVVGGPLPVDCISSSLLAAAAQERRRRGAFWGEAEAELARRRRLKGLHGLIWRLRDCGILRMPPRNWDPHKPAPRYA